MSEDETSSQAGRFASMAVAAVMAANPFGGLGDSQFSESFRDTAYENHPALELSAELGEAVGAYTDTRERAESIEDAIENPQEAPLYSLDRDISEVMGDEPDLEQADLADALTDAAVAMEPGEDVDLDEVGSADTAIEVADAALAADLADIATDADLGDVGDLGDAGDLGGDAVSFDAAGDAGGDVGGDGIGGF